MTAVAQRVSAWSWPRPIMNVRDLNAALRAGFELQLRYSDSGQCFYRLTRDGVPAPASVLSGGVASRAHRSGLLGSPTQSADRSYWFFKLTTRTSDAGETPEVSTMTATQSPTVQRVPLDMLIPSSTEAQSARRKSFDKTALQQLADSIKSAGLVNPILVRPIKHGGSDRFEIVAGERRFEASKLAKLDDVLCSVRELSDGQVLELQLIENLQREGLHELHEAEGYEQLRKLGHTADEIAAKVARSREYVFARLKLLALCPAARTAFRENQINASTALHIARIPGDKVQQQALKEILQGRGWGNEKEPLTSRAALDHIQKNYMLRLSDAPFDTADEKLLKSATACGRCPKNTAAQPELFGDVKASSAGVCTDLPCFRSKCAAAVDARLKAAKETGQEVIDGPRAKQLFPHGPDYSHGDYRSLDSKVWRAGNEVKLRKFLPEGTPVVLVRVHDRDTGGDVVVEAVPRAIADKAERTSRPASSSPSSNSDRKHRDAVKTAQAETKIRRTVYAQLRPHLKTFTRHTDELLVSRLLDTLSFEDRFELQLVRDPEKADKDKSWEWCGKLQKNLGDLTDSELAKLTWDLLLVTEIRASAGGGVRAENLLGYAKDHNVDVKKIRAAAAPAAKTKTPNKAKAAVKAKKTTAKKSHS